MWDIILKFVSENTIETALAGVLAAHGFALFIVNLTPTPRDDEIVGKAYKVVEWIAGIWRDRAKELPGEDLPGTRVVYPE